MTYTEYHGLQLKDDDSGIFYFGIEKLINRCQSILWTPIKDQPIEIQNLVKRFNNPSYWQCAHKLTDTVNKMIRAILFLNTELDIIQEKDNFLIDGVPIETALPFFNAMDIIPYHLDSLITYIRIIADCLSFAIPYFYTRTGLIPTDSFSKQRNWFLNLHNRKLDEEYSEILETNLEWFNQLAGENFVGMRDLNFHRFGTYQITFEPTTDKIHHITISHISEKGIVRNDILGDLKELLCGFFSYLDLTYLHFFNKVQNEIFPQTWNIIDISVNNSLKINNIATRLNLLPLVK